MEAPNWGDPERRYIKRRLSVYEKQTVINRDGRALIFPGSPHTEVEELVEVGFNIGDVHGIERDQTVADHLYDHYLDTAHIHWIEADEFITKAQGPFSYVHLDFCNYFDRTALSCVEGLTNKLEWVARVRLSLYRSRKGEIQQGFEELLHRKVLDGLLRMAAQDDHFASDARETMTLAADSRDVTRAITAVMLLNYTFGLQALNFADLVTADTDYPLPPVRGTHRINNVRRFQYHEPQSKHAMATIWADLMPLRGQAQMLSEDWRRREIVHVLECCRNPATEYGNPEVFA